MSCAGVFMSIPVLMKAQQELMMVTVGSEETQLLGKACKYFPRNPAQVNDLNGVLSELKAGIFALRAMVDQARECLCYQKET